MKKVILLLVFASLMISSCSKGDRGIKLEKGTPAYQLAKDLAQKLSFLDPDSNKALVTTRQFKITTGELFQIIQNNFGNRTDQIKSMAPNQLKDFIKQGVQGLAEQKLLLAEAQKAKVTITQAEVDSVLALQYKNAGGEEKFLDMLKKEGADFEQFKKDLHDGLIIQKHVETALADVMRVSEEEIQAAYQDQKASVQHILLMTQGKSEAEKQSIYKKMQDILARAKKGENFDALAKKFSEDPGSKDRGGLYANFERGDMVKPFEDAAFSVPVGQISDIVETQYGYHILKIVERKGETRPLEEVRAELENKVKMRNQRKQMEAYRNLVEKLKTENEYQIAAALN